MFFPAPVSEGAEEAGWWDQGCEWGLRVGFVRSLFWIFPLPRLSWIELTPYMCRVLFGSWLALRMPLQCPFSKPSGAESQIFKTESGPELYIYMYIILKHTHLYIYSLMKFCFRVHCSRVSVYICMFRFRYRTYTKYSTGSTKSSVQRPSRILKHRSPTKRKPTLWRIRLITSDGHFFVSSKNLQTQERHKTQKSHYIITHKRSVFCLHMFCSMLMKICIFSSARVWRSRRSRMMRSRVWVRSAGWVCAQFILELSYSPVFMDI